MVHLTSNVLSTLYITRVNYNMHKEKLKCGSTFTLLKKFLYINTYTHSMQFHPLVQENAVLSHIGVTFTLRTCIYSGTVRKVCATFCPQSP